jgi:hypothetical protein
MEEDGRRSFHGGRWMEDEGDGDDKVVGDEVSGADNYVRMDMNF